MLSSQEDDTKVGKSKFQAEEADPEILKNLRCPNCAKYYFPPIFLCPKGHNLCSHCKPVSVFDKSVFQDPVATTLPLASASGSSNVLNDPLPVSSANNQSVFGSEHPAPVAVSSMQPPLQPINIRVVGKQPRIVLSKVASTGFPFPNVPPVRIETFTQKEAIASETGKIPESYCWLCNKLYPKDEVRRSIARERSTKILDFPCGNLSNGCAYRSKLSQIIEHETICIFQRRSCFFKDCNWKGTTYDIINHLDKHGVISLNKVEILPQGKNIFCILFDSTFFLLKTIYISCKTLQFCVLYPDPSMGVKYKFEIFFMGYNEDILIGLSNYCEPLVNSNVDTNDSQSEYITIPFDFFKNFIVDLENIKFKINIIKLE